MEEEDFCLPLPLLPILLSSSLLLILLLLIVTLGIFYRDRKAEKDKKKAYDTFLSNSEENSKFVEDNLLPGLESQDNPRTNQYK